MFHQYGTATFDGTLSGPGTLTEAGSGTLVVRGNERAFSGTERMFAGTLELTSAGAAGSASILFAGPDTTLRIDGEAIPTNPISGFVAGDTIDLAGIRFNARDRPATAAPPWTSDGAARWSPR